MKNGINYFFVLVVAVGLVLLVRERLNTATNQKEYDRLTRRFGSLNVVDRDQFLVAQIESDTKDSFSWRYYVPPKLPLEQRIWSVNGSSAMLGDVSDDDHRFIHVRFQFDEDAILIHRLGTHGSGLSTLASGKTGNLLQEHWQDLEFSCQNSGHVPVDQAICFLTIRVPHRILTTLPPEFRTRFEKPVMQLAVGTPKAVDAVRTATASTAKEPAQ